ENVFRSFGYCRTPYTWVLGVDDVPVKGSFLEVMRVLDEGKYDFLVFNNPIMNEKNTIQCSAQFHLDAQRYEAPLAAIAERLGLWFVLAGMSGQILRTEHVKGYDFGRLVRETSVIYSHTIAYVECFAGRKVVLINLPLVFYKVTNGDVGHWKNAATKLGVF